MSKLESFLATIDPNGNRNETENRAAEAFNTFGQSRAAINDYNEFCNLLGRFLWHVDSYILGISHSPNPDPSYTRSMALNALNEIYGYNGEKVAYKIASTGVEGGLYKVLKNISSQRVRYYNSNEVDARVTAFLNSLSADEKFQVANAYIAKYRHLLPPELTEGSGRTIAAGKLHQILRQHPDLIRRMGQIGR